MIKVFFAVTRNLQENQLYLSIILLLKKILQFKKKDLNSIKKYEYEFNLKFQKIRIYIIL